MLFACVLGALACDAGLGAASSQSGRSPLDVARVLAARYPAAPSMSYIPALSWSGAIRLTQLTGDHQFAGKARREMEPFLFGAKPSIAEPYQLTSLAGHLAFADLAAFDGSASADALARKAADFILPETLPEKGSGLLPQSATPSTKGPGLFQDSATLTRPATDQRADTATIVRFPRGWTDDMFMASSLLSRVAARTQDSRYATAVGHLLTSYATTLQRADGIFIHAVEGPHAWGRGNGFAALGLADALQYVPQNWPDRPRVLEIFRRQMRGLLQHQSSDGMWRQVVDEPASYRELTVTAMTVAAMARGVRLGWLDKTFRPLIDRAWEALLTRVGADGSVADVCSSTGAGPTKEYYLNRPAVSGGDDRGGAMALTAALEMAQLTR